MASSAAQATTWVCRFTCIALLVAAIYPSYLDEQLAIFWPWLKAQPFFQHKMLKKNSRNFRVNGEMREKNRVYNLVLDEFWAKLYSKCKIRLCQNFKFWSQNQKSIFIPKSKFDLQNRSLLFLSNLVSRHQNSNSPPSIWSESSSLNFSSTKS